MSSSIARFAVLAALLLACGPGCGYFRGNSSEDDAELSELDVLDKAAPIEQVADQVASTVPEVAVPAPQEAVLELRMKVGDQFPLSKTVSHRLTQTDQGAQTVNISSSAMMLSLGVEDIRPNGMKLMKVMYHKVTYYQDIGDKKVSFSSEQPPAAVAPEAYLYAGLAKNWFQFWMGPENKITEIVGFNDFLKRCLQKIPANYAATIQQQLEATNNEDGLANFIDDSIGLLPFSHDPAHPGVVVKEGFRWELNPRQSNVPFQIVTKTDCFLKELKPSYAEIVLNGRISGPPTPVVVRSAAGPMKVMMKQGFCTGICRVDRNTGLPTNSEIKRDLELDIELPGGKILNQHKESVSTIISFPSQTVAAGAAPGAQQPAVQQASVQTADGKENHRNVVQATGSQPK